MRQRFCAELGCSKLTRARRCPEHAAAKEARDNGRRHERQRLHGRDTAAWRSKRARRLLLAGNRCELRLHGCTVEATTVHLAPEREGDHASATIDDLRAACAPCHGRVDAPRAAGSRA
jgi:5-methylcytosine-specific restriction endonuclease McrA